MSEHKATLRWERGDAEFSYQKYPRDHSWTFDGGHTMTGTAAPAYLGNPANVDPEEAFVAALSSCHMLTFLAIACKQKFVLDRYEDEAVGHMEKKRERQNGDHARGATSEDHMGRRYGRRRTKNLINCITPLTKTASSRIPSRPK